MVKSTKPEVAETAATEEIVVSSPPAAAPEVIAADVVVEPAAEVVAETKPIKEKKRKSSTIDMPDGGEKELEATKETKKGKGKKAKIDKAEPELAKESANESEILSEKADQMAEKSADPVLEENEKVEIA